MREQFGARSGRDRHEAATDTAGVAARGRAVDQADQVHVHAPRPRTDVTLDRRDVGVAGAAGERRPGRRLGIGRRVDDLERKLHAEAFVPIDLLRRLPQRQRGCLRGRVGTSDHPDRHGRVEFVGQEHVDGLIAASRPVIRGGNGSASITFAEK